MAESTLSVTYTTLRREIGRLLRWPREPANWSPDQALDGDDIIASGLRQFYAPAIMDGDNRAHRWSFLLVKSTLLTVAPYETGTVTIVDGVVTLASGTFPSWAAQGELVVDGGVYAVNTRDSGTQVTLHDTSLDVDAGTTYSLVRVAYDLPDDFAGLYGDLTYRPLNTPMVGRIRETTEDRLRGQYDYGGSQSGQPCACAVRPATFDGQEEGSRSELVIWPRADRVYELTYRYSVRAEMLDDDNPYPLGGMEHGETILQACLAAAELKFLDRIGEQQQKFLERLKASIEKDRAETVADRLGVEQPIPLDSEEDLGESLDYRSVAAPEIIFD